MPSGYTHGDTPKKAMVRGTISYLESQGLPVNKTAIFRHFKLTRSQGYAALAAPANKRNDPEWEETRGRPTKVSNDDQQRMERILWNPAYEDMHLNWAELAKHAGLQIECTKRTLHRTMGTLGYRRCLGCGRGWVNKRVRERRVQWARRMLEAFADNGESWKKVRFGGELHFGFGPDGAMRVVPRPGERYCLACDEPPAPVAPVANEEGAAEDEDESGNENENEAGNEAGHEAGNGKWPKDLHRINAWAAIGYNFKSDLVFYEGSTSPNTPGAISMSDYREKVLERAVKPWLNPSQGGPQSFILEEDTDSWAHGSSSRVNLAQQWKEVSGVRSHFNCGESPDLSPLDTVWPPGKRWKLATPLKDWEQKTMKQAAREAWRGIVEQDKVNVWVSFMVARLRAVIDSHGSIVPW